MTAKTCRDCKAEGITTRREAKYPGPRCFTHHRKITAERRAKAHAKHVEGTYGISAEEYWAIHAYQGGRCAICQRAKGTGGRKLAVDHDHETGEVRGLCCKSCNRDVLGHLRDSVDALQRAIDYLNNPPARAGLDKRI